MSPAKCSVAECDRHVTARGLCRMHYLREYRAGTHTAKPTRTRFECPTDHAHDLDTCWTVHRCRCDRCGHLRRMDRQRRRNRLRAYGREDQITVSRVLASPVREHVARIHAAGFGIERIGVAAAVGHGAMMDLWYGPRGYRRGQVADIGEHEPATRTIRASYAERLLALTVADIEAALLPPTGTERRLRALVAIGYTQTTLADRLGMDVGNFWTLIHGHRGSVKTETHAAVIALFAELWDKPLDGHSADHARRVAKVYGWAGPLAWDDIDDATEEPEGVTHVRERKASAGEVLDDVAFLLELGESPEQVATIVGRRVGAIAKLADREGRRELANLFGSLDRRKAAA